MDQIIVFFNSECLDLPLAVLGLIYFIKSLYYLNSSLVITSILVWVADILCQDFKKDFYKEVAHMLKNCKVNIILKLNFIN